MTEVNVIVFIVFFPTCSPNALAYQVAKLKRIGKLSLSLFFNMRQCRWRGVSCQGIYQSINHFFSRKRPLPQVFFHSTKHEKVEGQHSTMVSKLASEPSCPGFDSQCSKKIQRKKIVHVAKVNQ